MTELRGEHVRLRPLVPADAAPLRAIRATPEVTRWWDAVEDDFPSTDDPEATRYAIVVDGAVAGMVQYGEEHEPKYRHAWIDIFVDPARRGRGVGTDAVRTLARHLFEARGHHRLTIDPAASNAAAVRSYEKVGFRRVGITRRSERDGATGEWHDGLLMDLLTGELR